MDLIGRASESTKPAPDPTTVTLGSVSCAPTPRPCLHLHQRTRGPGSSPGICSARHSVRHLARHCSTCDASDPDRMRSNEGHPRRRTPPPATTDDGSSQEPVHNIDLAKSYNSKPTVSIPKVVKPKASFLKIKIVKTVQPYVPAFPFPFLNKSSLNKSSLNESCLNKSFSQEQLVQQWGASPQHFSSLSHCFHIQLLCRNKKNVSLNGLLLVEF